MEFCPKCGSLLMMKKTKFGCPRCNYVSSKKIELKIREKIMEKTRIGVIKGKHDESYPITDYKCEKCKNKKAYFWIQQMRSGDEPESKFYKCTKCKNVVRVDD